MKNIFPILFILGLLLSSCKFDIKIESLNHEEGFTKYYLLTQKVNAKSLIIYLHGSSTKSVIGHIDEQEYLQLSNIGTIFKSNFVKTCDIVLIDKSNIETGIIYEKSDREIMETYTFETIVKSSSKIIDKILESDNKYENVILIGSSLGACYLPRVYEVSNQKDKIDKIVLISHGGMSYYECFQILNNDNDFSLPENYRTGVEQIEKAYDDIMQNPDSLEKLYLGWPYRMWSGFMNYSPLDDLQNIQIPILMLHGSKDLMAPVQSSRIVVEKFKEENKTNLQFIEYEDMDHQLFNKKVITDILKFINQ